MSEKKAMPIKAQQKDNGLEEKSQRTRISQTRIPNLTLDEALRIAKAIADNYAFRATKPLNVAKAVNMLPTSGTFRVLCGASISYGLTDGGYNSDTINITKLGLRIVRPTVEGDEKKARKEAVLTPSIIHEFLSRYKEALFPREDIAKNVLREMDIPEDRIDDVYLMILSNAEKEGLFKEIKGKRYVSLDQDETEYEEDSDPSESQNIDDSAEMVALAPGEVTKDTNTEIGQNRVDKRDKKKVFISHGKNRDFIESITKLLSFGELESVVSVQTATVSIPVPDKVINDMRSCGAAIIHITSEEKVLDKDGKEKIIINPNVLIEIGAAMALYGRRFILLAEDGLTMPSNLQGLFLVKYKGTALDGDSTIKLLEAIRDIKKCELP